MPRLDPDRTLAGYRKPAAPCPARSSPEHINFLTRERDFCPFENCPADNFPSSAKGYTPLASAITHCFDRLRLNRRLLRVA